MEVWRDGVRGWGCKMVGQAEGTGAARAECDRRQAEGEGAW